ncbi:MAG: sigma-54-dependent Fis family transcriptional regulator [Planctomycetes bacterium]|nr:sigma-54-dependent Fis family transcriptional regulator [Planctomycetota bacterium]
MAAILIADDEEMLRDSLSAILTGAGHNVTAARDGQQAIQKFSQKRYELVITDLKMPKADGLEVLKAVKAALPAVPVIVVTAHGTVESAVEAMKQGAFDFLTKPFGADEIEARVQRALEHARLAREAATLREIVRERDDRPMVAGESAVMRGLLDQLARIAASDATVLIQGESGTGKEVVARQIHALSPRKDRPFLAVNCAALSAGLLESELFGHEKGAFTGADRERRGRFELAEGGTLLLDEVSEIDVQLQAKLLRVLQERSFERVGSSEPVRCDVRVLATTNRNLHDSIKQGRFREDLYFRLNVLPVALPALRDRPEEIGPLARFFLQRHARRLGREEPTLTADGERALKAYRWPGNVRELENLLERVCVLEQAAVFDAALLARHLGDNTGRPVVQAGGFAGYPPGTVPSIDEIERDLIVFALAELKGDRNAVAEKLGITTKTLRAKVQKWGLAGAEG